MDVTGLPGHAAARLRAAFVRAASGGRAARRAPEVILALIAPRTFLDPALGLARHVITGWAKRLALDPPLAQWVRPAWDRELASPSPKEPK